ncbi:uncharacterized protein AB675_4666 [Cyphellophora attinorum]|uniref:J domain-containing protein n=1 Tax=Cyphellophora attinorum TaxID=1664694 RepID=A0A0N1H2Z7_9EURO|nr:uncharacterized protein AB675_4666 [Phialophora attinorum]KPI39206.1 hypothetical protein AB675_4666 [Phialophora attinorum]
MSSSTFPPINGMFPRYYDLLEVHQNAAKQEIISSWRHLQLRNHPDKAGNAPEQVEKAAAINHAKDILTDNVQRAEYDRELAAEEARIAAAAAAAERQAEWAAAAAEADARSRGFGSTTNFGFNFGYEEASEPLFPQPTTNDENSNTAEDIPPRSDSASPGCTRVLASCPTHAHIPPYSPHLSDRAFGNPDYIDRSTGTAIPFQHFSPPASAYTAEFPHNGTKPTSAGWFAARSGCWKLHLEHQKAVDLAVECCDHAVLLSQRVVALRSELIFLEVREGLERRTAATYLVVELCHWAAAGYKYAKNSIDGSVRMRVEDAVPVLWAVHEQLLALGMCLRQALTAVNGYLADMDGEWLRGFLDGWDALVVVPEVLREGWKDVWERGRVDGLEGANWRRSEWEGWPVGGLVVRRMEG